MARRDLVVAENDYFVDESFLPGLAHFYSCQIDILGPCRLIFLCILFFSPRFFKVLVQEFNLKLDKGFLLSLNDIIASKQDQAETVSSWLLHYSFQCNCKFTRFLN